VRTEEVRVGVRVRVRPGYRKPQLRGAVGTIAAAKGAVRSHVRLLITAEDEHRAHREVLGGAIKEIRPRLEVTVSGFGDFEGELERLEPQVVICGRFRPVEPTTGDTLAWVELSMDPNQPTKIRVGESRWDCRSPSLEDLLSVIDEAEGLARSEEHPQES
jgi:hypothetical protein